MRIVQLLPELNEGGVERGTMELSRELVKRGHESVVISAGGKLQEQIEKDGGKHITFDVCSKNPFTVPLRIVKLRNLLKELEPDILHARSRVPAWLTFFANKKLHYPFVTTVHGLNSVNKYSEIMTKSDKIITVSEVVKEYILKHYGVDEDKVVAIQRGVNLDYFNVKMVDDTFIQEYKSRFLLIDSFIVTTVGRIVQAKDYETFVEAIALAKTKIPNIKGVIVGGVRSDKEDYFQRLKLFVDSLGLTDTIVFTGSQTKMPEIYYLSDLVVSTTPMMGNVARTVSEAVAMDTPVLTTTFEGLNNIIRPGINGDIIGTKNPNDLAKKIVKIHADMPKKVLETLPEEFTLKVLVNKTIDVYLDVLNDKV